MRPLFLSLLLLCGHAIFAQTGINTALQKQLDSVLELDQRYRIMLSEASSDTLKADSLSRTLGVARSELTSTLWDKQKLVDTSNMLFIAQVIRQYGYPGKSLVGEHAASTAWSVIQHSTRIEQYLDTIRKAGAEGEIPFTLVALMEDRYLMYHGKEQLYGTQVSCRKLKSSGKFECFVWPIQDAAAVNERRKKAGFEQTVEENAQRLNVVYRVVKMEELN